METPDSTIQKFLGDDYRFRVDVLKRYELVYPNSQDYNRYNGIGVYWLCKNNEII